jgi:DNA-binding transcriptional regulator YiaG
MSLSIATSARTSHLRRVAGYTRAAYRSRNEKAAFRPTDQGRARNEAPHGGEERAWRKNDRTIRAGVRTIREAARISQSQFAKLIGVNLRTLQNWEQRRTQPTGPAKALLKIVASNPKAIEALHG